LYTNKKPIMMKKIKLLLAIAVIFGMTACAGENKTESNTEAEAEEMMDEMNEEMEVVEGEEMEMAEDTTMMSGDSTMADTAATEEAMEETAE
tara:strand:- start:589 stop:864 length:276 start_codon:yes stop_codon:yes gene_type:complete